MASSVPPTSFRSLSAPIGTVESIQQQHIESCFSHDLLASSLTDSMKLKENFLAAYAELDRIVWHLDDGSSLDAYDLQRLFLIDTFNSALSECIVSKLSLWAQRIDAPLEFSTGRGEDEVSNRTIAQFRKDRDNEEQYQIKTLGPFCEQLSQKIDRVFQREALLPYRAQLKPRVEIFSHLPQRLTHFSRLTWIPARLWTPVTELPPLISTQPSCSSSAMVGHSAPVMPAFTARIAVTYAAKEGETLFLRGTGPGLSWSQGVPMQREGDAWVFETTEPFDASFVCKIVLNDVSFERGKDREIALGQNLAVDTLLF